MPDDTPPSRGWVTIEQYDDVRIVSLRGDHDVATAPRLREIVAQAMSAGRLVVVDLTAATFLDSTIALTLFKAYLADNPPRVRFVVPGDSPPRLVLDRLGFTTGLTIYRS